MSRGPDLGHVLLAGGEMENPQNGFVQRLVDYWALNLTTLEWHQLPGQMPLPLIEPRLTATPHGTNDSIIFLHRQ